MIDQSTRFPRAAAFLLFDGVEEGDFLGPWEMFGLWEAEASGPKRFTVAESSAPLRCVHGLRVLPEYDFASCPSFDILVVPGGRGVHRERTNTALLDFLRERQASAAHLLSICTGAFLLESAGLLDRKKATTHWEFLDQLRESGSVEVEEGARYVRDGRIWTAGGIFAGADMALAFIEAIETETAGEGRAVGAAGKVQLFAEYFPERRLYDPRMELSTAPIFIRRLFAL